MVCGRIIAVVLCIYNKNKSWDHRLQYSALLYEELTLWHSSGVCLLDAQPSTPQIYGVFLRSNLFPEIFLVLIRIVNKHVPAVWNSMGVEWTKIENLIKKGRHWYLTEKVHLAWSVLILENTAVTLPLWTFSQAGSRGWWKNLEASRYCTWSSAELGGAASRGWTIMGLNPTEWNICQNTQIESSLLLGAIFGQVLPLPLARLILC